MEKMIDGLDLVNALENVADEADVEYRGVQLHIGRDGSDRRITFESSIGDRRLPARALHADTRAGLQELVKIAVAVDYLIDQAERTVTYGPRS